jgi:hypothetical protein
MKSIIAKCGLVVALFFAICSSLSCQARPNLVIHQSDTLSVVLREMPAGYPSLAPFNYARVILPKDALIILESLNYDADSLLPSSQEQRLRVFTRLQAELLAPELSKALNLALPQEVAAFIVSDPEKPHRYTKGVAFVHGDELHLIIEELHKPVYREQGTTYQRQTPRWELLPGDKQRHYTSRPGGKGAITNWVITLLR